MLKGEVQRYPCSCHDSGVCWIVRHPNSPVAFSYETEEKAIETLNILRENENRST